MGDKVKQSNYGEKSINKNHFGGSYSSSAKNSVKNIKNIQLQNYQETYRKEKKKKDMEEKSFDDFSYDKPDGIRSAAADKYATTNLSNKKNISYHGILSESEGMRGRYQGKIRSSQGTYTAKVASGQEEYHTDAKERTYKSPGIKHIKFKQQPGTNESNFKKRHEIISKRVREIQQSQFLQGYARGIEKEKQKLQMSSKAAKDSLNKMIKQDEVGEEIITYGTTATTLTYKGITSTGRTIYKSAKGTVKVYKGIRSLPDKAKSTYKGVKATAHKVKKKYYGVKWKLRKIKRNYKKGGYSITAMKRMLKQYVKSLKNINSFKQISSKVLRITFNLVKYLVKILMQTIIYIIGFLAGSCGLIIILLLIIIVIIASVFGETSDGESLISYEGTHGIATDTYSVLLYDSKGINFAFSNVDSDFNVELAKLYESFWQDIADDYESAEQSSDPEYDNIKYEFKTDSGQEYINALDIYILMATYYGASVEQPYNGIELMNEEQKNRLKDLFEKMNSFETEDREENPYDYVDPNTGVQETIYENNHYIIITNKKYNDVEDDFLTSNITCQYGTLIQKQLRMYQMDNKFEYYFNNRAFMSDIHLDLTDVSKPELYFTFSGKRNAYPVH